MRSNSLVVLALTLAVGACASRPSAPPTTTPQQAAVGPVGVPALQIELDRIFNDPAFAHAIWAVVVQSLDSGEVIYRRNPLTLVMPASNMKIVTLSAAAERLGWDFTYETRLLTTATVQDGVLQGDLIVEGSGDPSINGRGGPATRVFERWADMLGEMGIRAIEGRIIGDDNAFEDEGLGSGWAWDYLGYGYATSVGALQYNENLVELSIRPSTQAGEPALVETSPARAGLDVDNHVITGENGRESALELRRLPGMSHLSVSGSIPMGGRPQTRTASVPNPTLFFVNALRDVLTSRGIEVRGEIADIDDIEPLKRESERVLLVHRSPPLSEIATVLMKVSQNLYAETLLKTLARPATPATTERGRSTVQDILTNWGIEDRYRIADGSGLSRNNLVSADMIVRILRRMHRDSRHAEPFAMTLPIAGADGTMANRLKNTRAEGNVRAKTGSIANARSLSGYVKTQDDEVLAFSMIANHFVVPQPAVDAAQDLAVERLANFRRR